MASADDVKKLAALARIEVKDEELEKFSKEFESILAYIGQIESLKVKNETKQLLRIHNVFREDGEPHETALYTEELAAQFPDRDGDYLKVKQIISYE